MAIAVVLTVQLSQTHEENKAEWAMIFNGTWESHPVVTRVGPTTSSNMRQAHCWCLSSQTLSPFVCIRFLVLLRCPVPPLHIEHATERRRWVPSIKITRCNCLEPLSLPFLFPRTTSPYNTPQPRIIQSRTEEAIPALVLAGHDANGSLRSRIGSRAVDAP